MLQTSECARLRGNGKLHVILFGFRDHQKTKAFRERQGQGLEKQHQGSEEGIPQRTLVRGI